MNNPYANNNFNQVQAIINGIDAKPRIIQCIQCVNEEKLIEACILQVYDKVDRIIVIEGAVKNKVEAGQATPDGHSLDRTIEIIEDIKANKDPDSKIIFVRIDRPWEHLEELKNTFFQYMQEGDWAFFTDTDEFIMPDVVDKLRKAISLEPWATEFVPSAFYHFWRDAHHIRRPSGDWGMQHQRFIRFQPGLNYVNHPVARDRDGNCTYFSPHYLARRFVLPEFVVYHYSYCRDDDDDIAQKKAFYDKELGQEKHGDVGVYARGGQTDEYLEGTEDLSTVLVFDEEHPPAMRSHLMVARHDDRFKATGTDEDGEMEHYKNAAPYDLKHMPLIWIYAVEAEQGDASKKGYEKLFNSVDV